MNEITKETFKNADTDTKLGILFDYHINLSSCINNIEIGLQKHPSDCEIRFGKLENKKLKDTAISGSLGFIGGFSAMLLKLKFWG